MDFETIILCVYRSVAGQGCPWRIAYEDNKTSQMTDEGVGMRQDGGSGYGQRQVDLWEIGCGLGDEGEYETEFKEEEKIK